MDAEFWHRRWAKKQIPFHERAPYELLVSHYDAMGLQSGMRVLVPLCGKTLDMVWLHERGCEVIGVELNLSAVEEFFAELDVTPERSAHGDLICFNIPGITIFVGDIFALTPEIIGQVDAVYDRAALVALPLEMRVQYATHLVGLTNGADQLVIVYDYDQSQTAGPPFSVPFVDVESLYRDHYRTTVIHQTEITGAFRERIRGTELVVHLQNKV